MKNLEHKVIRTLKALQMIIKLEDYKRLTNERIIQTEDNEIFFELQLAAKQLNVYNIRYFGSEIMLNEKEYEKYLEIDKVYAQYYQEIGDEFHEEQIIKIYNQNQFDISSLGRQHNVLMDAKEMKVT